MIEIPIPAGCFYGEKISGYRNIETHREYQKNKAIIYWKKLEVVEHIFTIRIEPRYNGIYTLNPAKAELMYFPTFFGRNAIEKVRIIN